jgi:hypothetical protein
MFYKRFSLAASMALLILVVAMPASASAFKLVKADGSAITKHTEIHLIGHTEVLDSSASGFKCEINTTLTTQDGTEANTEIIKTQQITNTCVGIGLFKGCAITKDTTAMTGKFTFDENAWTFGFSMNNTLGPCGVYTFSNWLFEPMKVVVGKAAITVGIMEGKGTNDDNAGKFNASISGELTIGQYTEAGVNKGSAKGVFKIV